ncbi:MAG: hypothetical protein H5T69_18265 [Chloroflexi bacterium]|nr:hypothetical protein [Chloroflexota bacterium]
MPQGQEYVAEALVLCQKMAEQLSTLEGLGKAKERLVAVADLLQAMEGRFFLRSKLCLPFARRCKEEAERVETALAAVSAGAAPASVEEALRALELAAHTLDERSQMQGMAIT